MGDANTSDPNDHTCWERPEDMDYARPAYAVSSAPDLGGEIAAALAAASIVFKDSPAYSNKLSTGAANIWKFARDQVKGSVSSLAFPKERLVSTTPPATGMSTYGVELGCITPRETPHIFS